MQFSADSAGDSVPASDRGQYGRSRRNLAEAAIRCFEERGFAETTVGDIASVAGYSERTFFRQFPTKEDAVFFDIPDFLALVTVLTTQKMSLPEAFDAVGVALVAGARGWETSGSGLAERRARLIHSEPALYRRFVEIATEWEVVIANVFAAARGDDPAQDLAAHVLAGSVVAGCRSSMRLWLSRSGSSLAGNMQEALELITTGFGVASHAVDPSADV